MGKTKEWLQDNMTYAEFIEHRVDYELLPWGDDWEQTDMLLRSQIGKPPNGKDWIPRRRIPVTAQSDIDLAAKICAMFGVDREEHRASD